MSADRADLHSPIPDRPAGDKPHPAEEHIRPAEDKPRPAEEHSRPAGGKPRPAEERSRPAGDKPRPAEAYIRPAVERIRPAEEHNRPAGEHNRPAEAYPETAYPVHSPEADLLSGADSADRRPETAGLGGGKSVSGTGFPGADRRGGLLGCIFYGGSHAF